MNLLKAAASRVLSEDLDAIGKALLASEATMADLQQQIRNQGWQQLSGGREKSEFNRQDIGSVVEMCRAAALKSPLVIRGLAIRQDYVFGQGVTIESDDEGSDAALKAFLDHPRNQRQLTGHQGFRYAQLEMDTTGNLFVACLGGAPGGAPINPPQVRTLPLEQIRGIIANPDDSEDIWFYRRERTVEGFDPAASDGRGAPQHVTEYHPSLQHWRESRGNATMRLKTIGGKAVRWDAPIAHRRRGGFGHWQWGLPLIYPAIDWATAHTRYLSNWDNFVTALAQVAIKMTGKGVTQDQLNAVKSAMQSSLKTGQGYETNPPPVSGSTLAIADKWQYEAFKASGMAPEIGDAKGFRLQVASVFGFPDTFFGDADQGNWATSRTLDRPTELGIKSEQQEWGDFLCEIGTWAVETSTSKRELGSKATVRASFPPILDHDPLESVEALAKAISAPIGSDLRGAEYAIRKALLAAAGADNLDEILADAEFDPEASAQDDPSDPPQPDPERDASEAIFRQRIRRIVEAAREMEKAA